MAENRIELTDQDVEDVIGGAYIFYKEDDGTKMCKVTGLGRFHCSASAQDRLVELKLIHRGEGLTPADYVQLLKNEGLFW